MPSRSAHSASVRGLAVDGDFDSLAFHVRGGLLPRPFHRTTFRVQKEGAGIPAPLMPERSNAQSWKSMNQTVSPSPHPANGSTGSVS